MNPILIGVISIIVIVDAYLALKMVDAAVDKGYTSQKAEHFFLCFFFPVLGYLYIIALPDLIVQEQNEHCLRLLAEIRNQNKLSSATEGEQNRE